MKIEAIHYPGTLPGGEFRIVSPSMAVLVLATFPCASASILIDHPIYQQSLVWTITTKALIPIACLWVFMCSFAEWYRIRLHI